jgi:ferritin
MVREEQIEEENLASLLLDKIKIVGGEKANGDALYLLDKDLEKRSGEMSLAQDATTTNPKKQAIGLVKSLGFIDKN